MSPPLEGGRVVQRCGLTPAGLAPQYLMRGNGMPYTARDNELHIPEDQLLRKLEAWEASLQKPPSLKEVLASDDAQLSGAYILREFRAAAAKAVIKRLDLVSQSLPAGVDGREGSAAYRLFSGIAKAWSLSADEQLAVLGLPSGPAASVRIEEAATANQPSVLELLAMLMDIFDAINTLFPEEQRADAWMRKPNKASPFRGRSALTLMAVDGVAGIRSVRSYLQGQIAG